jgi:hypothetical protein
MPSGVFPVPQFHSKPSRPDHELAQLASREERARIANRLVTLLGDARGPNLGAFRASTRARHAAIRENQDALTALALRLRDHEPITVRGAALAALLVDSPASPLRRGDGQELTDAIQAARVALETPDRDAADLVAAA